MWDRYKLNSQGPPSLESVLPNASTMTSPTHDTSVVHVSNELTVKIVNQTCPLNEKSKIESTLNVGLIDEGDKKVQVKNDNVLSRQQTVAKIQPYQVNQNNTSLGILMKWASKNQSEYRPSWVFKWSKTKSGWMPNGPVFKFHLNITQPDHLNTGQMNATLLMDAIFFILLLSIH